MLPPRARVGANCAHRITRPVVTASRAKQSRAREAFEAESASLRGLLAMTPRTVAVALMGAGLAATVPNLPVCRNAAIQLLFPSRLRACRPAPPRYDMDPRTDCRSRQPFCTGLAQPEPRDRAGRGRAPRGGASVGQHFRDFWREPGASR